MSDPQIAHQVDIHLTDASGTVLSGTNKLEETSKVTLNGSHTVQSRQNLNSDGHTEQNVTWHEYSGSMDYTVKADSTVQDTATDAAAAGTAAYLHIIDKPAATTGERKGRRYMIVFESHEANYEAGSNVTGTASFKVSGAPVDILAS